MKAAPALQRLRASFLIAGVECAERSPLYARICAAVAGDDEILALLLCAPPRQRRPTLLLAAIHDLLLGGAEHELAAHVPTVAAGRVASGDPGELALAFCREHRAGLERLLATRTTQTNEVNRAAALAPALVHATPPGAALQLVELGASAGLNLLADRFAHRYRAGVRGVSVPWGPETPHTPSVVCDCAVDGELPAWRALRIEARIGVDLEPVDLAEAAARRWLEACTWPDEADRVARLRAAIALARRDPPRVLRGDGPSLLGTLLADGLHPVVWHSWALAYATPARQRALGRTIDALGARRDLTWIYLEQPSKTPGLPTPVVAGVRHERADSALVAVRYRGGRRAIERLADTHPHVHRMRWLARRA
ncbi:MAG: hypothetical protein QOJ63_3638 [Solirubrobacteraceae bacterium]|nr:hypothetical protein [Solirubrobacteraceae bacterium]